MPSVPLEPFTIEDARRRVARGVAWFDSRLPDWAEPIDLDHFDVSNARMCAFGQNAEALLPSYYWDMLRESTPANEVCAPPDFHDVLDALDLTDEWAFEHGFAALPKPQVFSAATIGEINHDPALNARYALLQQAWVEVIRARQDATDDAFIGEIAGPLRLVAI